MPSIETVIRSINREFVPQFEEKLRNFLAEQDKKWLIEQIIRLSLDAHSLEEMDRKSLHQAKSQKRTERLGRVRELALDEPKLISFMSQYENYDQTRLIEEGFLINPIPPKGSEILPPHSRSTGGEALLTLAKDTLFGLLFGDEQTNTSFQRVQQELLTMTLPAFKADTLDFMKATTELSAQGTWQDPESISHDLRADNILLQVEFGEIESENIGHGIIRTLTLINHLEINEQVLYARMENIEQSTLIG
jgi:hypothetical protein